MIRLKFFSVLSLLLIVPNMVGAVTSNDFSIRVLVGDDLTPPSTPTLLSVEPVSTSQINVTWSVATDNFALAGYELFRDGIAVATTTMTSYADTGLLPETLYEYEVRAFDSSFNRSSTSLPQATTTLAIPVIPPTPTSTSTDTGTESTKLLQLASSVIVDVTETSATLSWSTTLPAGYTVRFGRTLANVIGYVSSDFLRREHRTILTELEPGMRYEFEIIGVTDRGQIVSLRRQSFVTKAPEYVPVEVSNVSRFLAEQRGNYDVMLTWDAPLLPGARVRVLRSPLQFPLNRTDGYVVYEGVATSLLDEDAVRDIDRQFYTIFVISSDGSVSSGAVASVEVFRGGSVSTSTEGVEPAPSPVALQNFYPEMIVVEQGTTTQTFASPEIVLWHTTPLLFRIERQHLQSHLKSIVVEMRDPTDQRRRYMFLLRLNRDGTAYEALIAPLKVVGSSRFTVTIVDFEEKVVGRYTTQASFIEGTTDDSEVFFPDTIVATVRPALPYFYTTSIMLLVIFVVILWLHQRRQRQSYRDG